MASEGSIDGADIVCYCPPWIVVADDEDCLGLSPYEFVTLIADRHFGEVKRAMNRAGTRMVGIVLRSTFEPTIKISADKAIC